jgi:HlyD family secretion protein
MKKRTLKRTIISLTIGSIAVLLLFLFFMKRNGSEPRFKTEQVAIGDIRTVVTAGGTVNAVTTVLVGTQVSGTIQQIFVDYNSLVKRGQLLAQIDPTPFAAQVDQAKANLLIAEANMQKAQAALLDADRTEKRNSELFNRNLVPRSDLDTADVNLETAKAQLSASRAQVAQAEAALKLAETNLMYTKILSPINGVVISKNVDVGQTVAASFQTPTLFSIAQDLTKMQIDTNVDEADIGNVMVGQDVEFTVDAYPDMSFGGKVWQVRNDPITVQNVVTYDVVIKVDNPDLKLKPGMTANVTIITLIKKDVLKIPNAALRFVPQENNTPKTPQKGYGVWIVEAGIPKRIPVSIGISDGRYTELVSGNLKEGQEVIISSLQKTESRTRPPGFRMF